MKNHSPQTKSKRTQKIEGNYSKDSVDQKDKTEDKEPEETNSKKLVFIPSGSDDQETLGDKRQKHSWTRIHYEYCYPEEDVKEFVKTLKDEIKEYKWINCVNKKIFRSIDKLAGKELI